MITPQDARKKRRALLSSFGSNEGLTCLDELEKHFQVNLPVFQGKPGSFDPLDAMRRDAYREVFLHIRHQLELAQDERKKRTDFFEDEDDDHLADEM